MTEPVRSPRNQRVAAAARLRRARERDLTGKTLLEGPAVIEAASAAGADLSVVFVHEDDAVWADTAREAGYEVLRVAQAALDRLAPSQHPRGPVAVLEVPPSQRIEGPPVVVLWDVGDPGNAGTLIRAAAAFGFGVMFGPGTVDVWSPKVLRAAAGAHFATQIERGPRVVDDLRERGLTTVATIVEGGSSPATLREIPAPALILGSEPHGLPAEVVAACDRRVTIPMLAAESLNVAVAGAILMYEHSTSVESAGSSPD